MKPYVNLNVEKSIGSIEFFHPQSNSLPSKVLKELADTIISVAQRDDILVIILKSGGERTFCAGASFDELLEITDAESGKEFFWALPMLLMLLGNAQNLF